MTKEEIREKRGSYLLAKNRDKTSFKLEEKLITNLYLKKRILQNYEEYNNYGHISESVIEPDEELTRDKIINLNIIDKIMDQPKIPSPPKKEKKTRKRLSPNTKKEREEIAQTRRNISNLIKKDREDKKIQELLDKLDKGMMIKL